MNPNHPSSHHSSTVASAIGVLDIHAPQFYDIQLSTIPMEWLQRNWYTVWIRYGTTSWPDDRNIYISTKSLCHADARKSSEWVGTKSGCWIGVDTQWSPAVVRATFEMIIVSFPSPRYLSRQNVMIAHYVVTVILLNYLLYYILWMDTNFKVLKII